jgi:hypothetical protein
MLLDDIGTLLQAAGVGQLGVTLFKSFMPASPDTAVALIEYGGLAPERHMAALPGRMTLEQPSIQLLSRSTDYVIARDKAELAFRALDGYSGTLGGRRYWVAANQSPYYLHRDANDRAWIAFNALVKKTLG